MRVNEKEPDSFGSFDAHHARARDAFSKGRLAEAEALCLQALDLISEDVGVLNLLGQVFLGQNRPSEAAESFSKAIQLNPKLANIHFNLALAQQAQGQIGAAIQSVRAAIALDPAVPVLHAKLGQLLCISGASVDAVIVLRHALSIDPKSVPVRLNLAQALSDLGEMAEAEKVARAALFQSPKDATAHRMLGRIHQLNGQFAEASTCFETAISLQPTQAAAYFALAYSKRVSSVDQDLLKRMEVLLAGPTFNEPDRGLVHYALGKGYDDLGEFDLAMSHFESANTIALAAVKASNQEFNSDLDSRKVDRLIELFPAELFLKPTASMLTEQRPIFIVGMIRSGTTLVEQVLSRHPDVFAAGELRYWTENEPRMHFELASQSSSVPDVVSWRIGYEAELDRVSVSAPRITDKMPLNYWALGLIHLAYPDAKIIHCRRNPLDTCLSIYVTPFRRGPEFGHDFENIASAYSNYLRLMDHWRSVIPRDQLLEVDYEELVDSPDPSIRRMIEFAGLTWNDACLNPNFNSGPVNTPSQWQVRQPVYRNSVDRWKNYNKYLGHILHLPHEEEA